jgi:ribosomal protein L37AE/L43A
MRRIGEPDGPAKARAARLKARGLCTACTRPLVLRELTPVSALWACWVCGETLVARRGSPLFSRARELSSGAAP